MMRNVILTCILLVSAELAHADAAPWQIFGGYSYINFDALEQRECIERGFGVEFSAVLKPELEIVGSFSANYADRLHIVKRGVAVEQRLSSMVHRDSRGSLESSCFRIRNRPADRTGTNCISGLSG